MNYTTEDSFMIAEGAGGKLYIFMKAKKDTPKTPRIIYDGKDHAIFLRNQEQRIILDYIHPEVRDSLRKSLEVMVVETILDNIKESYPVGMQMVDSIPVDWEKIGLTTWEKAYLSESGQ